MESFADTLAPAAPPMTAAQIPPPPPPPKGSFVDIIAAGFGAGPDRMGAYQQGLDSGSQYKLRTAQTESALAEAEKRRAEALRESTRNNLIARAQADPNFRPSTADLFTIATGAGDFGQGALRFQEHGFRGLLGDPATDPEVAFAAGQGVQGEVLPQIKALGSGRELDLLTQEAYTNPLGDADIAATIALEGQRNRSPVSSTGGGTADGWKTVTVGGRRLRERTNPETGEYEYEFVTDPQMLGRERMFAERVRVAGESMADALENISAMPVGASMGVFGVGGSPGKSILGSTKDTLRNAATSEAVQWYTAALAGANRALAVLEAAGLSPSGSTQQSFEALAWREGDPESTRLYKLAEMRQTVDNAMQTALTNPAISPDMRAQVAAIQQRVAAAVPFSPMDVLLLERSPSSMTLGDLIKTTSGAKSAGAPAQPGAAPAAAPASEPVRVTTIEEARALPPGTVFITPDGRRKVR